MHAPVVQWKAKCLARGVGKGMALIPGLDVDPTTDTSQKKIRMILQLKPLKTSFTLSI